MIPLTWYQSDAHEVIQIYSMQLRVFYILHCVLINMCICIYIYDYVYFFYDYI